jgi:NAD(P)-dependent dehydrogenase (short-subunit alcohol dehydrogenase family)
MNMKLAGKKIVIIGGSSGIGLATAKAAASEGAEVIIASRSEEKLRRARNQIHGEVAALSVNVMDESSVKSFFSKVAEFDHLTTPGSEAAMGLFLDLDTKAARKAFESKFWGQYQAAKYGAPLIRTGGSITFFSGIWSRRPVLGSSVIAAINSAIEGLGRALATELAPIRVNVVSPGIVDTPIYSGMAAADREGMFREAAASIPVKRIARPEEIAQGVLYLMTNEYTTGTTLFVDGGRTLQ